MATNGTSSILTQGTIAATTTAQRIGTGQCDEVRVMNPLVDPVGGATQTANVVVGTATVQYRTLVPGDEISYSVSDVDRIYAKTISGTANVYWEAINVVDS